MFSDFSMFSADEDTWVGRGVQDARTHIPSQQSHRQLAVRRIRSRFKQKRKFPQPWKGCGNCATNCTTASDSEDSEGEDLQEERGNQSSTTSLQFLLPEGSYMEGVLPLRYGEESRPYLLLNKVNCPSMEIISEHIHRMWRIERPKVILSLYCEPEYFSLWKRRKIYDDLQTGLIKLASTTDVWLVTNGANLGVGKLVGDAMKREKARQEYILLKHDEDQPMLRAIGILPFCPVAHMMPRWRIIQDEMTEKWQLNPDHTHFIVVDDGSNNNLNAEHDIRLQMQHHYRSPSQVENDLPGTTSRKRPAIPVVCVLIQGGPSSIQFIQQCVQQETPVLLLKGSGKAADLLAFAYEEIKERPPQEDWMQYLRAELSKRIFKTFPLLSQEEVLELKESIINCVNESIKEDQVFLSIVEVHSFHDELENLDKFILTAILKAQADVSDEHVVQRDLQLTLQWNRPDLALSEIFQSPYFPDTIKIPPRLFEKALLKKDREEFVELFLSQGFEPQNFLTKNRYRRMFEKADDREFIKSVFGAMGHNLPDFGVLPDNFLVSLKKVICRIAEVDAYFFGYENPNKERPNTEKTALVCTSFQKKTKVMTDLLLWAILVNKQRLVRIIWEQTEHPITLALFIRRVYMSLTNYMEDVTLRREMKTLVSEYEDLAVEVLDIGYKESASKATDIMSEMIPGSKVKTAIEVAYDSKCKKFISHPCCQKWMKRKYMGGISVKKMAVGFLPDWLKILLSAFLIIPMFFFINFTFLRSGAEGQKAQKKMEIAMSSQQKELENNGHQNPTYQYLERQLEEGCETSCRYCTGYTCSCTLNCCLLNFCRRVKALWTAPITKYWAHVLCYMIFLVLLSLSGLLPGCGNKWLDVTISMWMTTSIIELSRSIYRDAEMFHRSSGKRNFWAYVETSLIVSVWVAHFVVKVVGTRVGFIDIKDAKLLLAIMVFFFFLRLLYVFAPNSLSLGPRLVMLRKMIQNDLFVFFRLLIVFMCIHGVVSQILLQPWHQLDSDVVEMLVWRPWLHVWLTPFKYLEGDCEDLVLVPPPDHGQPPSWSMPNTTQPTCPVETSDVCEGHWYLYISLTFYLICVRFGLLTVLFAMFNDTYQRVHGESREIWMYQRYKLIADLGRRDPLPPPLVVFHYIYKIGRYMCWFLKCRIVTKIRVAYGDKSHSALDVMDGGVYAVDSGEGDEDRYSFWKSCAYSFNCQQRKKAVQEDNQMTQAEVYEQVSDDLSRLNVRVLRRHERLHDRVVKVEKMMQDSMLTLETIKHLLMRKESGEVEGVQTTQTGAVLHIAARQSPYFGTKKKRFPVFDKYVPWKVLFVEYDPPRYSAPMEYFSEWLRQFADEVDPSTQKPAPVWNEVVGYKMTIWHEEEEDEREEQEEVIQLDRQSWIEDKDTEVVIRYDISSEDIPQNPMGRTGLMGKGALFRWGPNHSMLAICTRWKHSVDPATGDELEEFLLVEGKRVLEFLSYKEPDFQEWAIPGAMTAGLESKYSVMHRAFCTKALEKQPEVVDRHMDESKVKQLFEAYTGDQPGGPSLERDDPVDTFSVAMIYRGYVDDPRNTDNAWVETEAWHFHYESGESFPEEEMVTAGSRWQEVSRHVKLFASHASVIHEAAARLNAYF